MLSLKNSIYLVILLFLYQNHLFGQGWKVQFSKDRKIEVLSKIYTENDSEGNSFQIIEYKTKTIADTELSKCIFMMKNVENHKDFYSDTEVSEKIEDISDNKCLVYFYMDSPWPIPNSDCVSIMTFNENKETKSASFTLIAAPDNLEMKDVKRMTLSETVYSFQETEDGKILFEIYSKMKPVVNAPDWLIKSWFPDGPIEMNENIINLIKLQ